MLLTHKGQLKTSQHFCILEESNLALLRAERESFALFSGQDSNLTDFLIFVF